RFKFDQDAHDHGRKVVLGHVFGPNTGAEMAYNRWLDKKVPAGLQEGYEVLDLLANQPSTAKFISGKLCRYFIGTDDTPVREKAAKAYLDSGGDIRKTLRPISTSAELLSGP